MTLYSKLKRKITHGRDLFRALDGNPTMRRAAFVGLELMKMRRDMEMQVDGVTLMLRTHSQDIWTARNCLVHGEFLPVGKAVHDLPHGLIIDGGGYIGTAAIALARMFPKATIVTLEPSAENYRLLVQNVRAFPNIIPMNKALMGASRKARLHNRGGRELGFTVIERPADEPGDFMYEIEGISLADIMKSQRKQGIDVLKLDIEGAEKAVLDHAEEWVEQVGAMFVELHDRIIHGCSRAYYTATQGMRDVWVDGGEKVLAVNDAYFHTIENMPLANGNGHRHLSAHVMGAEGGRGILVEA